jgi:hypothetical protein
MSAVCLCSTPRPRQRRFRRLYGHRPAFWPQGQLPPNDTPTSRLNERVSLAVWLDPPNLRIEATSSKLAGSPQGTRVARSAVRRAPRRGFPRKVRGLPAQNARFPTQGIYPSSRGQHREGGEGRISDTHALTKQQIRCLEELSENHEVVSTGDGPPIVCGPRGELLWVKANGQPGGRCRKRPVVPRRPRVASDCLAALKTKDVQGTCAPGRGGTGPGALPLDLGGRF